MAIKERHRWGVCVVAALAGAVLLGGCHSDSAQGQAANAPAPPPLTPQQQQAMAQQGQEAASQRKQGEAAAQHGASTPSGQ